MDITSTSWEWTSPHRERITRQRRTMWIVIGVLVVLLSAGMGLTAPDDAESGDVLFITIIAPAIVVGLALLADRLVLAPAVGFALRVDERQVLHVDRGRRSFDVPLGGSQISVAKVRGGYTTQLSLLLRPSFWYLTVDPAEGRRRMIRLPSGATLRPLPDDEARRIEEALRRRAG